MNHQKIYESIIEKAKSENRNKLKKKHKDYIYYERHHILPKCMKGTDDKDNLVLLTAKEHFICHKLLTFIYPENRDLATAFHYMVFGGRLINKVNLSSRDYQYAREIVSKLMSGENHPFYGKNHTLESRRKMSKSHIGMKQSRETIRKRVEQCDLKRDEIKLKQSKSLMGHNVSRETREKISKSKKGMSFSDEHIKNLKESHIGKNQTDETKKKISNKLKGKKKGPMSEEHKQKLKEAWTRRKQNNF